MRFRRDIIKWLFVKFDDSDFKYSKYFIYNPSRLDDIFQSCTNIPSLEIEITQLKRRLRYLEEKIAKVATDKMGWQDMNIQRQLKEAQVALVILKFFTNTYCNFRIN